MSYRLINANDLALKYPEVNDMPCIYADLPKGLDGRYYGLTKRMQRWIPVTERLPEDCRNVLVTLAGQDTTYTYVDFYVHSEERWYSDDEVIAWMPLPKPYKAGE